MKDYKELEVVKRSRELIKIVYEESKTFPSNEAYCLVPQIRRSAISVLSNIAEGLGRQHKKDTLQFLHISRGSLYELESQILVAMDLNYISSNNYETLISKTETCKKLLNGFIKYYRTIS